MNTTKFYELLAREGYPISHEYITGIRQLSPDELESLRPAINVADAKRRPFKRLGALKLSFFAFGEGELPYPHTHGEHIMLPVEWLNDVRKAEAHSIAKTLLHELVHVYQRFYPLETNALLVDAWGIRITGAGRSLIRDNPDLNFIRYKGHGDSEHPFELMAYRLADILMEGGGSEFLMPYL